MVVDTYQLILLIMMVLMIIVIMLSIVITMTMSIIAIMLIPVNRFYLANPVDHFDHTITLIKLKRLIACM